MESPNLIGLGSHDSMRVQPRGQLEPQRHFGRRHASRAVIRSNCGSVQLGEPRLRARPFHAGCSAGAVFPRMLHMVLMRKICQYFKINYFE